MHSFKRNHIWFKRNWSYLQIKRWITWISEHSRRMGCVRVAEAIPWYDLFFHCSMHIFQVIHYFKSTGINCKYWYLFFAYMYKPISQLNTFAMAIVSCFTHSLLYPFSASPFPSFVNFQLQSFSASPLLSFTNFQLESNFHTNRMENCFYLESIVTPSFSSRPVLFSFQVMFFFILSMRWWRSIQAFIFPRIQN